MAWPRSQVARSMRHRKKGVPGERPGMSAKSKRRSREDSRMELLSPKVQTKASTICMVVSYSWANFTALSERRKHSTKARAKVR